jgi:kynurenine 3-monooxygenase
MQNRPQSITLVGAGLTGPLLAISLLQRGFKVNIFERRPDMRQVRSSAGRSINLAVSTRGIHALREAGLWEEMRHRRTNFSTVRQERHRGHQFDFAR